MNSKLLLGIMGMILSVFSNQIKAASTDFEDPMQLVEGVKQDKYCGGYKFINRSDFLNWLENHTPKTVKLKSSRTKQDKYTTFLFLYCLYDNKGNICNLDMKYKTDNDVVPKVVFSNNFIKNILRDIETKKSYGNFKYRNKDDVLSYPEMVQLKKAQLMSIITLKNYATTQLSYTVVDEEDNIFNLLLRSRNAKINEKFDDVSKKTRKHLLTLY